MTSLNFNEFYVCLLICGPYQIQKANVKFKIRSVRGQASDGQLISTSNSFLDVTLQVQLIFLIQIVKPNVLQHALAKS